MTRPTLSLLLSLDDNELLWSKWWPCHFRSVFSEQGLLSMRVPLLYVAFAFAIPRKCTYDSRRVYRSSTLYTNLSLQEGYTGWQNMMQTTVVNVLQ